MGQPAATIGRIHVVKQPLARLLIVYYWLPIALSFFLFLSQALLYERRKPELIELSFYPLYLVVGGLMKSFVKKISETFVSLQANGSLGEKGAQTLVGRFETRLNSWWGNVVGTALGFFILSFYYFQLLELPKILASPESLTTKLGHLFSSVAVISIDVLLAYAVGVAIWKASLTAWQFRQLGIGTQLKISPFHPDRCGGLAAIGRLLFSLSLILIAIGLFLSSWILYGRSINCRFIQSNFNSAYCYFAPWFAAVLIGTLGLSLFIFFWPLLTVHRLMKEEAARYQARLGTFARQISDLEESFLSHGFQLEGNKRPSEAAVVEGLAGKIAHVQALRDLYSHQRKIPTWPVNFETLGKFFGAQLPLFISIPTSVLSLWEKLGL